MKEKTPREILIDHEAFKLYNIICGIAMVLTLLLSGFPLATAIFLIAFAVNALLLMFVPEIAGFKQYARLRSAELNNAELHDELYLMSRKIGYATSKFEQFEKWIKESQKLISDEEEIIKLERLKTQYYMTLKAYTMFQSSSGGKEQEAVAIIRRLENIAEEYYSNHIFGKSSNVVIDLENAISETKLEKQIEEELSHTSRRR